MKDERIKVSECFRQVTLSCDEAGPGSVIVRWGDVEVVAFAYGICFHVSVTIDNIGPKLPPYNKPAGLEFNLESLENSGTSNDSVPNIQTILQSCLSCYGKVLNGDHFQTSVSIKIIQSSREFNSLISAIILCASLALFRLNTSQVDVVIPISISCAIDGSFIVDPDESQSCILPTATMAILPSTSGLLWFSGTCPRGSGNTGFSPSDIVSIMSVCAVSVCKFYDQVVSPFIESWKR